MSYIKIKNLTKRFGDVSAVHNLNLEVKEGGFLVLLGPSGCGKTTTLRCIAGLASPDEGEIYIANRLVNDLSPKDRDVAMVFQNYALYPHMTVFDNMAFPLRMAKIPKDEVEKSVRHTLELLKISHLSKRKPNQLSGGEAQRVAVGKAIVRKPKVFLMDEPLSNVDAKLRLYMRTELKSLQKHVMITTIYVTHDQAEAMTMGDRVAVMNRGRIEQVAPPEEIYDYPDNIFVGGFVGSPPMNFIDCSLTEKKGAAFLDAGVFTLPLLPNMKKMIQKTATSSELVLGVRPEDLMIGKSRTQERFIEAYVYMVEPLGSEIIVDLKLEENILKVRVPPTVKVNFGENVWAGFRMNKIRVFDKKTEKTLF